MKKQYLSIILLLVALLSCSKKDTLFKEISPKASNIIFENNLNQTEEFNLIEYLYFYNGGGVAVGDINNDGLNDIYLSANQEENKLYLNKGNFIFEDITAKANLSSPGGWKTKPHNGTRDYLIQLIIFESYLSLDSKPYFQNFDKLEVDYKET